MGLVTAVLTESVRINTETFISGTTTLAGDAADVQQKSIGAGLSGVATAISAFTAAKLVEIYLLSDNDLTVTFTLGTGALVINLLAGIPWQWKNTYASTIPCPFAYNAVSAAATNSGASAAILTSRVLVTA